MPSYAFAIGNVRMYLRIGPKTRTYRRFSKTRPDARTEAKKEDVSGETRTYGNPKSVISYGMSWTGQGGGVAVDWCEAGVRSTAAARKPQRHGAPADENRESTNPDGGPADEGAAE